MNRSCPGNCAQGDGAAVASAVADVGVSGVAVFFWQAVMDSPSKIAKKMQLIALINL